MKYLFKIFKNIAKYFSIIALIHILYLNVFVPVKLSLEQILFIAIEVVKVCDRKGVDVSTLSPDQLDELIELTINSIKQVFKENGFRFIPNLSRPAHGAGEVVTYQGALGVAKPNLGSLIRYQVGTNPYSVAVGLALLVIFFPLYVTKNQNQNKLMI